MLCTIKYLADGKLFSQNLYSLQYAAFLMDNNIKNISTINPNITEIHTIYSSKYKLISEKQMCHYALFSSILKMLCNYDIAISIPSKNSMRRTSAINALPESH